MKRHSSWKKLFYPTPQGSVLDRFLSNTFLCDLFSTPFCVIYFQHLFVWFIFFLDSVTAVGYADDTPYSVNKTKYFLKKRNQAILFQWFGFNQLKVNSGKSQIGNDNVSVNIDDNTITSENKN